MRRFIVLCLCTVLAACQANYRSQGNISTKVFDDTEIYFDLALKNAPSNGDVLRLDAGRVVLKKVTLPSYELQPRVRVNVTLKSNGDPWDKSGSLFVIPSDSMQNLTDFEGGQFDLKSLKQQYPAVSLASTPEFSYKPNIELLRFMTPFGVGFYNDHERTKDRKPPYIPFWVDHVTWSQDITHLLSAIEGEVYIGVYIDTWDKRGYKISVSLDYQESSYRGEEKTRVTVLPLINTVKYASGQRHYDGFAESDLSVDFELPQGAANVKLYYLTTGHGGHSKGDEFIKRENILFLNESEIKRFTPWRDDCASFRRFNPSSGTWPAKDIFPESTSTERVASSDLSRSNWCPGSDVSPEVIALPELGEGQHKLSVSIPEAQLAKENEHNYWMVSAYITYEEE